LRSTAATAVANVASVRVVERQDRDGRRFITGGVPITARRHRLLSFPTGYNATGGTRRAGSRGGLRVTSTQMLAARGQAFVLRSKSSSSVWLWCLRLAERRGRNRIRLYVGSSTKVLTGRHSGRD